MERNRLEGPLGNAISALLSAAAIDFGKWIKRVGQCWLFFSSPLKMIFPVPAPLLPHNVHFSASTLGFKHAGGFPSCRRLVERQRHHR